jgi:hypothetical protein
LQKELNLHNFASRYFLHGAYIIIGGYGAFTFLVIPKRIINRFKTSVDLFIPYWFLSTYFVLIFILYLYYDLGEQFGWWTLRDSGRYFISARDQEPIEFILSLGFLLFVGINGWRLTLGRFPFTSSNRSTYQA